MEPGINGILLRIKWLVTSLERWRVGGAGRWVSGAGKWAGWRRWVQWMAQEGGVGGAGGRGKWCRSDLMVGTCTAKRFRMAIPGAGQ